MFDKPIAEHDGRLYVRALGDHHEERLQTLCPRERDYFSVIGARHARASLARRRARAVAVDQSTLDSARATRAAASRSSASTRRAQSALTRRHRASATSASVCRVCGDVAHVALVAEVRPARHAARTCREVGPFAASRSRSRRSRSAPPARVAARCRLPLTSLARPPNALCAILLLPLVFCCAAACCNTITLYARRRRSGWARVCQLFAARCCDR